MLVLAEISRKKPVRIPQSRDLFNPCTLVTHDVALFSVVSRHGHCSYNQFGLSHGADQIGSRS